MTDRDLTPAEARAEVEAFMGEGWTCHAWPGIHVRAYVVAQAHGFELCFNAPTYRAAVSSLKQAWRDAVRPFVQAADLAAFAEGVAYQRGRKQSATREARIARVLKEDGNNG